MQNPDEAPVDPAVRTKNRKTFLILLAFFITPTLMGYLAYYGKWIDGSNSVNKGTLLSPPIALENLDLRMDDGNLFAQPTLRGRWWLFYQVPSHCEQACLNSILQTRQVRLALGKNTDRVKRVLIIDPEWLTAFPELAEQIKSGHEDSLILAPSTIMQSTDNPLEPGLIYIVDPLGNMIMTYPAYEDAKEAILKAKLILKDLNKLLKVSRIG